MRDSTDVYTSMSARRGTALSRMPFVAAVRCVPFRSLNRSGISGPIGKPGSVTGSSQCGERASHDRPPPTERNVLTYKVFRYARADRGCWSVRLAASRRPDRIIACGC